MRQIIKFKNKNNLNGFSLLELLVVLAIIGIILSFVVPNVINRPDEARKAKLLNDIKVIEAALGLYKLDYGQYDREGEWRFDQPTLLRPAASPAAACVSW